MVSGHSGQAGLVARSHVAKDLDVELDVVTIQLQVTTVDHVSAQTLRRDHALCEIAQVIRWRLCPPRDTNNVVQLVL